MRRRTILKRLGTATAVTVGASGSVVATSDPETITWEFDDGHEETFTRWAFEDHPDTPRLAEIQESTTCCCCTSSDDCAPCFVCPDRCQDDFESA